MPEICKILAVCIGPGGLPKPAQDGAVTLSAEGFANDKHRYHRHGGPDKAVCAYTEMDYLALEDQGYKPNDPLAQGEWEGGAFGENILIDDVNPQRVRLGDCFYTSTVVMQVTQPRQPCKNLNVYHRDLMKVIEAQFRAGFYLKVLQGGTLQAGETLYRENLRGMMLEQVNTLFYVTLRTGSPAEQRQAAEALLTQEHLSEDFKEDVRRKLAKLS